MMGDPIRAEFGEPNRPLTGLRLLLVEDEALVAMELEDLISSLGAAAVGPFGRVADALEALGRERVKGAVLDVRLAGDAPLPSPGLRARMFCGSLPIQSFLSPAARLVRYGTGIGKCGASVSHSTMQNLS